MLFGTLEFYGLLMTTLILVLSSIIGVGIEYR
jgi:hypothetical protein